MNNYWLIGGGAALALLLIASVVAAVLQREAEFAPGSAEAAVQRYLHALEEDDFQTAYDALSPELREECSIEDMFGGRDPEIWGLGDRRVTLKSARTLDDAKYVTVRIARFRNEPFGPSQGSFQETFELRQFDGDWRFSQYPWPLFSCDRDAPRFDTRYID